MAVVHDPNAAEAAERSARIVRDVGVALFAAGLLTNFAAPGLARARRRMVGYRSNFWMKVDRPGPLLLSLGVALMQAAGGKAE
jgi:hypothetical protein